MELRLDTSKVYAIALEGGGAKGGYEIGVWQALEEAGVRYAAVSGTSVGALNGALMAMRDFPKAVEAWSNIRMSSIVAVSESEEGDLKKLFGGAMPIGELPEYLPKLLSLLKNRGMDIAPMRAWMRAVIEPERIRSSDVALFVTTGLRGKRYEYFEKEAIETLYGVDGAVKDRREKYRSTYTWQLVTGIVLCVLAVIPLFVTMMIFGDQDTPYNDYRYAAAVGVLLLLVAIGVFLIVRACIVWGGFQMLLETGDYTRAQKLENKKNEHIDAIYWGTAIVIYLAWSFITMQWQMTWIVWPIAGVGYGLLVAVLRAVRSRG